MQETNSYLSGGFFLTEMEINLIKMFAIYEKEDFILSSITSMKKPLIELMDYIFSSIYVIQTVT